MAVAALSSTRDFPSVPKDIELFGADEALTRRFVLRLGGQLRSKIQFLKGSLDPGVHSLITCRRLQCIPWRGWREYQGVSPISVVRHKAATCGTADQWAEGREARNVGVTLRISETGSRFTPAIKSKHGSTQTRNGFEEDFVDCHVIGGRSRAGAEEMPGLRFQA